MSRVKATTVKLPETTLERLKQEARSTGRSVAALIRERLDVPPDRGAESVYALTAELAGSVSGSRKPATNQRRRFGRS